MVEGIKVMVLKLWGKEKLWWKEKLCIKVMVEVLKLWGKELKLRWRY